MNDTNPAEADRDRPAATCSAIEEKSQTTSEVAHALSERLTAMAHYFGAARGHLAKEDYMAVEQLMMRFLEQCDRAREIAEQLRAMTREARR